jgi:translation elongation factor EF-4
MVHNERARVMGAYIAGKLKRVIDPQPFKIKIKAQVGDRIIASENKSADKRDKGGQSQVDKNKARKAASKKARMAGDVIIPNDAFIRVLKS